MKKIKILYVHHAQGWGGAPINMLNIIEQLDLKKFDVNVLFLKDSIVSNILKEKGINYTIANSIFYKKYYSYYTHTDAGFVKFYKIRTLLIKLISWICSRYYFASQELKKHDFDILHLNSSALTDWLAPGTKQGKVIYHIQEPFSKGYFGIRFTFFRNLVNKYANKIFAISEDNGNRINLPHKTEIIYNFIIEPKNKVEFTSKKSFLYVGGASPIKGFYTLVESIKFINKDIEMVFLGDYPNVKPELWLKTLLRKILYRKAHKAYKAMIYLKQFPNVVIKNKVNNIEPFLLNTSVLISPFSTPHFSRPIIEAFVFGRPVISSNIAGIEEIVINGKNGLLFEKDNPLALANCINKLANDPSKLKEMSICAKNSSMKFLPHPNMEKITKCYNELMGV